MVNVTIRGVRDDVYRVFKAKAALRGISVQKALEEAIKLWIKSFDEEFSSRDVDDVIRFLREDFDIHQIHTFDLEDFGKISGVKCLLPISRKSFQKFMKWVENKGIKE